MVESALFSVLIVLPRLKRYFNSTKSHCLIQTFNSFEICLFIKYSSSLPEDKLNLYGCIISRGLSQTESVNGSIMVIGFKWKPTNF